MVRTRSLVLLSLTVGLAVVASGCGGNGGTVNVTLREFEVVPEEASIGAGEVTFEATNEGPDDPHEFVVIRTDLDPADLPTDENGVVDESGEGIEVIGEIEEFPVGETESVTFDLDAGSYVLICNVFEEAEQESHYQNGMRTSFTVQS
jgi:uncharacterized cupredoxin-like copper-binding protein